jgi:hypothetical protein
MMERIVSGIFSGFLAFAAVVAVCGAVDYVEQMPLAVTAMETMLMLVRVAFCVSVAAFTGLVALVCGADAVRG